MSDGELIKELVDQYANLQRIENAADPQQEIADQKRILEAKLQAFGIVTEDIKNLYS